MKKRLVSLLCVFALTFSLLGFVIQPVTASAAYEYTYTGYTGEDTGIMDPDLIQNIKDTYFLPAVADGTIINGGTPKGLIQLNVDTSIRHQYMEGFGASAVWVGPNSDLFDEDALDTMLLLLYDEEVGIGFEGYRHNIGGGSVGNLLPKAETVCIEVAPGVYDTSVDAVSMEMLKKAAQIGAESIGLIYYTPPLRMTIAGVTSGNPDGGTNLKADCFDDYAEYVVGTANAIIADGIPVKYVSPFNEPSWGGTGYDPHVASQEHCYYTADEVYELTDLIAQVMERENSSFGIAAAESPWWNITEYTTELLGRYLENPTIMKHLDHFCAHSYANTAEQKEGIADFFLAHPEVSLHQTEECRKNMAFFNYEMIETASMASLLHEDFTILNISEWDFWCITDPEIEDRVGSGGSLFEIDKDGNLYLAKRFYVAGQYSKFVTDTTRVEMTMPEDDSFYGTAYISQDEETVTLVINNYHETSQLVSFEGLEGMMGKAYQTSEQYNLQYIGDIDATYGYEVPAMSVTTIVFNKSDAVGAYGEPTLEEPKPPVDDPFAETPIPDGAETVSVSISIGANYSVSPRINKMVKGGDQTFRIAAKAGYSIAWVTVNGKPVELDSDGSLTLTDVTENVEIKVKSYKSNQYTLYPVLDFEEFSTGIDLMDTQGIYYSNTWGSDQFNIQASPKPVHQGQSLVFQYDSRESPLHAVFPTKEGAFGFSNWGGVQEIWAYVDASEASGQVSLQMCFTAQYYDFHTAVNDYTRFELKQDNQTHVQEFSFFLMDENGQWVSTDNTRWGRAMLPEGYVGWIRLPIGSFTCDVNGRTPTNLFNVINIGFAFDVSTATSGASSQVYIDSISLLIDPAAANYRQEGNPTESFIVDLSTGEEEIPEPPVVPDDPEPTEPSEPATPSVTEPAGTPAENPDAPVSLIPIFIALGAAIIILGAAIIVKRRRKPEEKKDEPTE